MNCKEILNPEIQQGSVVMLKWKGQDDEETNRLMRWIEAYGRGPYEICQRPDKEHVSLFHFGDPEKKLINFGSTGSALIHIGYVEQCLPF
jgi:hypothetical protein